MSIYQSVSAVYDALFGTKKELTNAALCKWRVAGTVNGTDTLICAAMSDTCHGSFDTPRCRRLYERKP